MPTAADWERLTVRMVHKTCPDRVTHGLLRSDEYCRKCGLDGKDVSKHLRRASGAYFIR